MLVFLFKQKTADEMRISVWSSDVCSSDLSRPTTATRTARLAAALGVVLACWVVRAVAASVRLMAFGDSLTHGYGLASGETFPEQLEAALRADCLDVTVLNAGNSGDTTAGGLARLDWALADDPDAVILELGANDGLRGLDPDATYDNLDAMLAKLADAGLPVLLAGMLAPPNLGRDYGEAFNAIYPRLRSEAHTSELQSLMPISYAVFCLKKNTKNHKTTQK